VGYEGGATTVLVVLDADGRVRHVIGGSLPSADELVEMLSGR
jgi:predicted transcriptional regulator